MKKNILKSKKIVNKNGGFTLKEVLKEPKDNVLSLITTYNNKKQPVKRLAYSDNNFKNLFFTSKFERKKNKSYVQYDAFEEKQDDIWQSIIAKFDKNGRQIVTSMFYDKDFKKLFLKSNRKYNKNGTYTEKVRDYESRQSAIREYSKNNKLKSDFVYKDMNFKLLLHVQYTKFFRNGNYQIKESYVNKDSFISTYNDKRQLISYKLYKDTNFEQLFEKREYEYQDNKLIRETNTYPKKHLTYTDTYEYNEAGLQTKEKSFINGNLSFINKWEYLSEERKIIHTQYNSSEKIISKNEYFKDGKIFVSYKNEKISKIATLKNTDDGMFYNEQIFDTEKTVEYPSIIRFYTRGEFPYIKKYYKDNNFEKIYSEEKTKYLRNGKTCIYKQYFENPTDKDFLSEIHEYDKDENLLKVKTYKDKNFKKLLRVEYPKDGK